MTRKQMAVAKAISALYIVKVECSSHLWPDDEAKIDSVINTLNKLRNVK